jgi:phenylalanyl-tRNA synthetase alpha chain
VCVNCDLQALEQDGLKSIDDAKTLDELSLVEKKFFGRKSGLLSSAMQSLRDLSPDEKKEQGAKLNSVKKKLEDALLNKREAFEHEKMSALSKEDVLDVTMDLPERDRGHLHLIPEFIRKVEEVFGRMGFDTAYGPEIETEEYNFDLLNFLPGHPARDMQDTFVMRGKGKEKRVLRTHTSPVQIRYAKEHKPPFRMICPGVVYRKDADATHSPMFHQFEGMMIGKDISLGHLKGVMIEAVKELIAPDLEYRFRTGFFPFTEPSMELDIRWRGDKETKEGQWLEVAGCGMTHPNVLRNCGIDPDKWQGFAFGFGVERLLMIKHQIPNIRLFYQGDMRFLRQF